MGPSFSLFTHLSYPPCTGVSTVFSRLFDMCRCIQCIYIKYLKANSLVPIQIQENKSSIPFSRMFWVPSMEVISPFILQLWGPCSLSWQERTNKSEFIGFLHEGSASDRAILTDACKHDFHVPEGRYFLGNGGFPSCHELLVPYGGVQYHLPEWESAKNNDVFWCLNLTLGDFHFTD